MNFAIKQARRRLQKAAASAAGLMRALTHTNTKQAAGSHRERARELQI
jgi:hypothetical protein